MPAPAFSASIVTFLPEPGLFGAALASLATAIVEARRRGALGEAQVFVIDNGPERERGAIESALAAWPSQAGSIELIAGHGNVGYGRANNLALARAASEAHLIMNPDVELETAAIAEALAALAEHPEVGLVAPAAYDEGGRLLYLCKRYPSVWVLFLRSFAPERLRRRHARVLDEYEMRDVIGERFVSGVPLASGCFMLARTMLLERLGGFDPRFFMYFEDYDLSVRMGRESLVAYVPRARIVHHGGGASRKGPRHVAWFMASAWRFFARHGWRVS
jgi:GT2 family glycosyltransferase